MIAGEAITVGGTADADGTYGVLACEHFAGRAKAMRTASSPRRPNAGLRRRASGAHPAAFGAGALPGARGDNHDPHNQGRLRIQFAWLTAKATTWVRLLMPHAGPDRGMLFLLEIGDEVSIAFEGGDPERPVIVGSVWNGAQQPPTEGFWQPKTVNQDEFAANTIKRIVTKSGIRVTLNDTPGQESIHLATPSNNEVLVSERASETGRPAIALRTTGDIHVNAVMGHVHLRAAKHSRQVAVPLPVKPKLNGILANTPARMAYAMPKITGATTS